MLEIGYDEQGGVRLAGRFDAAQAAKAEQFLDGVEGRCDVDLSGLDYVSSAGLGVLLKTQKRLMGAGGGLRLVNVSRHIRDILRYSGFDSIFEIEESTAG